MCFIWQKAADTAVKKQNFIPKILVQARKFEADTSKENNSLDQKLKIIKKAEWTKAKES